MDYGRRAKEAGTRAQGPVPAWKREKADEKKTEDERVVR